MAVLGPGLLGGSVLHAVHFRANSASKPLQAAVWGRRREPIDRLISAGVVDQGTTRLEELFADPHSAPDLVVLATPIGFMGDLSRVIAAHATRDLIVTDVGSTKGDLVSELEAIFASNDKIQFVGSHPMAGSEKSGLEFASQHLFENAVCILTPTAKTDPEALARVKGFWEWLGSKTAVLSPNDHDEVVARISHLPHIVAAALVHVGMTQTETGTAPVNFSGGGFRDTTRIAGGQPEMWTEILLENRQTICESLHELIRSLESFQQSLNKSDADTIRHFLADAKTKRDLLNQPS